MRFSNNQDDLLKNVYKLPYELIHYEIYQYIPKIITIFLTKQNYIQEHYLIKQYINKGQIENYYRAMVRQDNDFVIRQLLVENKERWFNMKKYYYKGCIHSTYIAFLKYYAIENESIKCGALMNEISTELILKKKQHKKNKLKYILWKT